MWSCLAIYNCRGTSAVTFGVNLVFQLASAACFFATTSNSTAADHSEHFTWRIYDSYYVGILALNLVKSVIFACWIVPILYPESKMGMHVWSLPWFERALAVDHRRKSLKVNAAIAIVSVAFALGLGVTLIFTSPNSSGNGICSDIPSSQLFPLLYIDNTGDLTITAHCDVNELTDVSTVSGNLLIQLLVESPVNLNINSVSGSCVIRGNSMSSLQLASVAYVGEIITINANLRLEYINFESLGTAGGIYVADNPLLVSVNMLVLTAIEQTLIVTSNNALSVLEFPQLFSIGSVLAIYDNAMLTFVGLPLLQDVFDVRFEMCNNGNGFVVPSNVLALSAMYGVRCDLQNGSDVCGMLVLCS